MGVGIVKAVKKQEIKRRIYEHLLLCMTQLTFIDWIDTVYGQGLPIRKEAVSEYKIEKLQEMIIIVENQIRKKVEK
jgi:hypothetical protein